MKFIFIVCLLEVIIIFSVVACQKLFFPDNPHLYPQYNSLYYPNQFYPINYPFTRPYQYNPYQWSEGENMLTYSRPEYWKDHRGLIDTKNALKIANPEYYVYNRGVVNNNYYNSKPMIQHFDDPSSYIRNPYQYYSNPYLSDYRKNFQFYNNHPFSSYKYGLPTKFSPNFNKNGPENLLWDTTSSKNNPTGTNATLLPLLTQLIPVNTSESLSLAQLSSTLANGSNFNKNSSLNLTTSEVSNPSSPASNTTSTTSETNLTLTTSSGGNINKILSNKRLELANSPNKTINESTVSFSSNITFPITTLSRLTSKKNASRSNTSNVVLGSSSNVTSPKLSAFQLWNLSSSAWNMTNPRSLSSFANLSINDQLEAAILYVDSIKKLAETDLKSKLYAYANLSSNLELVVIKSLVENISLCSAWKNIPVPKSIYNASKLCIQSTNNEAQQSYDNYYNQIDSSFRYLQLLVENRIGVCQRKRREMSRINCEQLLKNEFSLAIDAMLQNIVLSFLSTENILNHLQNRVGNCVLETFPNILQQLKNIGLEINNCVTTA